MGNDEGWEKGEVRRGGEGDGTNMDWSSLDRILLYLSLENLTMGRMGWVGCYLKVECCLIMSTNFSEFPLTDINH